MPIFWLWSIFVIIKFVPIYLYIYVYYINNEKFFVCLKLCVKIPVLIVPFNCVHIVLMIKYLASFSLLSVY